jgi:ribonuclease VapC
MIDCVVDSSVVMAVLYGEPGIDTAITRLSQAAISSVNFAEVVSKLCEDGVSAAEAQAHILEFDLEVVPFDLDQATIAGALRPITRAQGLSLGDRACLALARQRNVTVLTADRAWSRLSGFDITLIR